MQSRQRRQGQHDFPLVHADGIAQAQALRCRRTGKNALRCNSAPGASCAGTWKPRRLISYSITNASALVWLWLR